MRFQLIPDRQGQICRHLDVNQETDGEVYIMIGNTESKTTPEFVKLNDLQRNLSNPAQTETHTLPANKFTVLADSLEKYVSSWNSEPPPVDLKAYVISDPDDVKQFFHDLHKILDVEFYPDDDFCLLTDKNDFSIFTEQEGIYLNKIMMDCFNVCDAAEVDIYDLAGQVHVDVLRSKGIWPE